MSCTTFCFAVAVKQDTGIGSLHPFFLLIFSDEFPYIKVVDSKILSP